MKLRLRSVIRCGWLRSVFGLRFLMPPTLSCNKCKTAQAAEGDSWCTACTAWEFIGRELGGSWDSNGARLLASDLVVTTARQIRALRSLSAGLARQAPSHPPAGESRAKGASVAAERDSLPRRRSSVPPPPPSAKEEELSEEVDLEESEEEDESPDHRPLEGGSRRPPEPEGPPPSRHREAREETGTRRGGGGRDSSQPRHRERERSGRRRKSNRRGGRRHQRLARLADNPHLLVHRKPGSEFWDLQSQRRGVLEDDRLGR